jgi:hypothetical protein
MRIVHIQHENLDWNLGFHGFKSRAIRSKNVVKELEYLLYEGMPKILKPSDTPTL